jgi:uncharacterized protein with GYD domain
MIDGTALCPRRVRKEQAYGDLHRAGAGHGNLRTQTLRAFHGETMTRILGKLPS